MFKIENNNDIYLTKGDTAYLEVKLEKDESFYAGDEVILSVKSKLNDNVEYNFQKKVTINEDSLTALIKIEPKDTKEMSPKAYYYDIQLIKNNGDIFTIITPDEGKPKTNFYLLKEVTI